MKTLLILALLALATVPAIARLGETQEQLTARYGAGKSLSDSNTLVFNTQGIKVYATLFDGRCINLQYTATDSLARPFTPQDALTVLEQIKGTGTWVEQPPPVSPFKPEYYRIFKHSTLPWKATVLRDTLLLEDTAGTAARDKANAAKLKGF